MLKRSFYCAMAMVVMLAGFAANGHSGPQAGQFFLSPMIGGHGFEGNQDPFETGEELDHGFTFGLGLGYEFTRHLGTELTFNITPTEAQPGDFSVDVFTGRLDLFCNLMPEKDLVPYVAAGLGTLTFTNPDLDNDTDFMVNYGGGVKYYLNEAVALRADIRHLIAFGDTHSNLLYTVGMVFNFGGCKGQASAGRKDVDKDSDGDGIADSKDSCSGTPVGASVDSRGCWVIKDLHFETGDSAIKSGSQKNLDEVVRVMEKNPDLKLEVQGYTDNQGSAEFNRDLSEKRAQAVRSYIVSKGVDKDRITAKGYGIENPAASNDTPEGRAKNRRVELKPLF